MPFLFVALYGLLSGFFDVLPVSSFAHQAVLQNVFGVDGSLHLYKFLIHLASLSALVFTSMSSITALLREQRILSFPRRGMQAERKFTYELRFVKTALLAAIISSAAILFTGRRIPSFLVIGILCVVNGVIVLVPEYLPYGNKTAKYMSRMDGVAFGFLSCLGLLPGLSRVATMQCYASLRGADRTRSCNWILLTLIPVFVILSVFDLVGMFTAGIGTVTFLTFLSFVLGAFLSFVGTFAGVTVFRFLAAKVGFVGFGYYSIGTGLLAFFLYLMV